MPLQQIKRRYTEKVLFECEVTAEQQASGIAVQVALEKAALAGSYLAGAHLAGANLAGANLVGAYLVGANLARAYLAGAKWRDGVTISRAPLLIDGLLWRVYILDHHMQIGCELHSLADWASFDDARIVQMDGRDALRFWRAHKSTLLSLAAADGRGVEQIKEAA